jgi:N-terminal C2 in EEIG1 and EHBP1 proteins
MLTKSSRPKLKLNLQIHELSAIPLVTGQVFAKWHILHSSKGECRGKTERAPIIDHKAGWTDYQRDCTFKVGIGRNGVLQERMLMIEVYVEMISGRERFRIGMVAVNLSEYASVKSETRRYLLQESKMNSTVKVTIAVVHLEGTKDYATPPLKKAQMFHGITNLLAETKDLPQISKGMEQLEAKTVWRSPTQEMYRRTLAAQWRLQAGEFPPAEVVEDIFKGGTGWKADAPKSPERKAYFSPFSTSRAPVSERPPQSKEPRRQLDRPLSIHSRFHRNPTMNTRPITPLSPDDQSDVDEDELFDEYMRAEAPSQRIGHLRTASMVSITPRIRRRARERDNTVSSEAWDKQELQSGKRSWKTPNLEAVEDKIEARRLARESRSMNPSAAVSSAATSAPGSSGTDSIMSPNDPLFQNGGLVSETNGKENGGMSADDSDTSG